MRVIQVTEPGGPEVLTLADVADPNPGPGQLLVQVAAAGVNYIDTYQRSGAYPIPTPFVLGLEGAGTVTAVGDGVEGFAPGDRVAWADAQGSYAEAVLVKASSAVPVPAETPDDIAAGALLQGMTAHYLCTSTYAVQPGDTVLVHAAAGGVGLLLTQLVKARGGRVLGTVSTPAKAELARSAGADVVLGYDDLAKQVRSETADDGVAAVYDGVGASTFDAGLDCLRPRGVMALYGAASGPVPSVDPQVLNRKGSLFLTRPKLGDYTGTRAELLWRAEDVLGALGRGELDLRVGGRYPLAAAAQAHEDLQGRRTTGKLLLVA